MDLIERLGLTCPIFQAPMAGVSTPAMAAAVSNAGGLGALGLGAAGMTGARQMLAEALALCGGPINANFFCHAATVRDTRREQAWLDALAPEFARFGASPPTELREIYTSFADDLAMREMVLEMSPGVVSLHFGLVDPGWISACQAAGNLVFASATSLTEARAAQAARVDAVVAQGIEAGGHRGIFDPGGADEALGVDDLVRLFCAALDVPVIAAGGLMDGADVARVLALGAVAAQLGTAFIDCDESAADLSYRAALRAPDANPSVLTDVLSGRPARCLKNRITAWGAQKQGVPAYPVAYDALKALHSAASVAGVSGYGPQWAGLGAPRARRGGAGDMLQAIAAEVLEAETKSAP